MNEQPDTIAARIAAVEQRLLVAVVQRDDHARLLARGEITRLKELFSPTPERDSPVARGCTATAPRVPAA